MGGVRICMVLATSLFVPCSLLAQGGWTAWEAGRRVHPQASRRAEFRFEDLAAREALRRSRPYHEKLLNPPFKPKGLSVPRWIQLEAERRRPGSPPTRPGPPIFSPAPVIDFLGLSDNSPLFPPDTHGAVGPGHVMTFLNTEVRIQDKAGTLLSTTSLDAFWAPAGARNPFDPRIVYDPFADRWIATTLDAPATASSAVLVAVSQTSDPMGGWNAYNVNVGSTGAWVDFPTLGFNKNWIVVQANAFGLAGGFDSSRIYAFDKADLYAGGAGSYTEFRRFDIGITQQPAVTLDPNLDTMYLVNEWAGNQGGQGFLRVFSITGPVGSEVLNDGPFVASPVPWTSFPPVIDNGFAPQRDTNTRVMTNGSDLGNAVFRNGSLWTVHAIHVPAGNPSYSAVQWWEIDPVDGSVLQRGLIEDPSRMVFFAYPSLSVNGRNDVLVGHAMFAADRHPSGGYSFRSGGDPADTMQTPFQYKDGEGIWEGIDGFGRNRWGDYSHTVVDPENDVDFWTIQEYALPQQGRSRWSTWWAKVSVAAEICDDGQDNNGDDLVDCQDPICMADEDTDGRVAMPCGEDCDDGNPDVWSDPVPVEDLRFVGKDRFVWRDQRPATGPGTGYRVLIGSVEDLPVGAGLELCPAWPGPEAAYDIPGFIPLAGPQYFLVQALNSCDPAPMLWGRNSAGDPRVSEACN